VDDGELFDFQIVITLCLLNHCNEALIFDINPLDITQIINMIWEENIDISIVNAFINIIDNKWTQLSKNYIINDQSVVKMPQRGDDTTILILNMIFERQIKRLFEFGMK
jgi:hypothetical protein